MKKLDLRNIFNSKMNKLNLLLFQLQKLLKIHFKNSLYKLLSRKNIKVDIFATNWFLTLFSYAIKSEEILILWDLFLAKGWKVILQLCLQIFSEISRKIKDSDDFEEIMNHFKSIFENIKITKPFLDKVTSYKIRTQELKDYEKQFKKRQSSHFKKTKKKNVPLIDHKNNKNVFSPNSPLLEELKANQSRTFGNVQYNRLVAKKIKINM